MGKTDGRASNWFALSLGAWLFFNLSLALPLYAQDAASEVCNKNLARCILDVDSKLAKTPTASHMWFHQKLNLMDLLFRAQQYQRVIVEADALLAMSNLPLRVEIHANMYKVKLATDEERAGMGAYIKSVDQAFNSLAGSDPQSIIDYATFQLYTGDFKKGQRLLLDLEKKFKKHHNSKIKKQIYTILGYLAHRLEDRESTLRYLQLSLHNANRDNDLHYRLMSHYNVARALHFLGRSDEALPKFRAVIEQAKAIDEPSYQSLTNLRIAEISLQQNDLNSSKAAMAGIDTKHLLSHDQVLYNELKTSLALPR